MVSARAACAVSLKEVLHVAHRVYVCLFVSCGVRYELLLGTALNCTKGNVFQLCQATVLNQTVSGRQQNQVSLLYLYRARNKVTQLSIPTHAQLQRHRLKYIKNHLKKLLHVSVFDYLQGVTMSSLKSLLLLTTVGCFYAKSGDVAACRVVCIGLYLKSA